MSTRQRKGRSSRSSGGSNGAGNSGRRATGKPSPDRSNRLKWLLTVLALTTTLLVSLQVYIRLGRQGGIASSSWWGKGDVARRGGASGKSDTGKIDMARTLKAVSQQFRQEFAAVTGGGDGAAVAEAKDQQRISGEQDKQRGNGAGSNGMAAIPGQGVIDHEDNDLKKAPHVPDKTDEQAEEDKRITMEDLDQDTLKAMYDMLYARRS